MGCAEEIDLCPICRTKVEATVIENVSNEEKARRVQKAEKIHNLKRMYQNLILDKVRFPSQSTYGPLSKFITEAQYYRPRWGYFLLNDGWNEARAFASGL